MQLALPAAHLLSLELCLSHLLVLVLQLLLVGCYLLLRRCLLLLLLLHRKLLQLLESDLFWRLLSEIRRRRQWRHRLLRLVHRLIGRRLWGLALRDLSVRGSRLPISVGCL